MCVCVCARGGGEEMQNIHGISMPVMSAVILKSKWVVVVEA